MNELFDLNLRWQSRNIDAVAGGAISPQPLSLSLLCFLLPTSFSLPSMTAITCKADIARGKGERGAGRGRPAGAAARARAFPTHAAYVHMLQFEAKREKYLDHSLLHRQSS